MKLTGIKSQFNCSEFDFSGKAVGVDVVSKAASGEVSGVFVEAGVDWVDVGDGVWLELELDEEP